VFLRVLARNDTKRIWYEDNAKEWRLSVGHAEFWRGGRTRPYLAFALMMAALSKSPVTAIVVTYQSMRTVGGTLAAARRCYDQGLLNMVLVDNGSTDATPELLSREADWARVILTGHNNGFGRGCNIGLEHVTSPYTVFINPDAMVEPDALRTMLEFMEKHPMAGIVGPAIVEGEPGGATILQDTGRRPTAWTIVRNSMPLVGYLSLSWDIVPGSAPTRTGWVCGAVLMIRTDLARRLNGFDPRFFLYWEEMDLCKRAEEAGWEVWAIGAAVAHHVGGASSIEDETRINGCVAEHYFQSRYYYLAKHEGRFAAILAEMVDFLMTGMRALVDLARGRGLRRLRPRLRAPLFSEPAKISHER
jgi:N-acetylglucosaminyl-diphospho-decaprenol L-rhamnosyltransferase